MIIAKKSRLNYFEKIIKLLMGLMLVEGFYLA
jgi:hypothetical protein